MELPEVVSNYTRKIRFGCGNVYVSINEFANLPVRTFLKLGKTGLCTRALLEAIGRLVTVMLEYNIPLQRIQLTLAGIRCDKGIVGEGRLSCLDGVAFELKRYLKEKEN